MSSGKEYLSIFAFQYSLIKKENQLDLTYDIFSIEKGRAVLYSDFVTILRVVSMKYITELATSQSQKPQFSLPQNIK